MRMGPNLKLKRFKQPFEKGPNLALMLIVKMKLYSLIESQSSKCTIITFRKLGEKKKSALGGWQLDLARAPPVTTFSQ